MLTVLVSWTSALRPKSALFAKQMSRIRAKRTKTMRFMLTIVALLDSKRHATLHKEPGC
jgi:hypothetical protein